MINEQTMTEFLKNALISTSRDTGIDLQFLRIKMKLTEGLDSVNLKALEKDKEVSDLSWAKILGLKTVFKGQIIEGLVNRLTSLSEKNGIEKNEVNLVIYPTQNGTPILHLWNSEKAKKVIEIKELI